MPLPGYFGPSGETHECDVYTIYHPKMKGSLRLAANQSSFSRTFQIGRKMRFRQTDSGNFRSEVTRMKVSFSAATNVMKSFFFFLNAYFCHSFIRKEAVD